MKDMTKGPVTKLILLFAVPLLFGNLLQQVYSMVDTLVVGRFVGYQALAAVGATVSVVQLLLGLALGISNGVSVVTAQYFGAKLENNVRKSVATGMVLCGGASVIIGLAGALCARPIYELMQTPEDIIDSAVLYTVIMFIGAPATMLYNYVASILRAFGDSKTPVIGLLIASVINIVLDLVFVVVFHWDVAGVGVATVLSQLVSGILCGLYALRKLPILKFRKGDFTWDGNMVRAQLKVGIPLAFQQSVLALGIVFMQVILNTLGSLTIAAYTVVARIDVFLYSCMSAFGTAATTFAAQNFGAGRIDRIKKGVRGSCVITVSICAAFTLLVNLFAFQLMRAFLRPDETEVIGMGVQYLRLAPLFYPLLGMIFIMHSTEQGIGKAVIAMLASFVELIARPAAAFFLTAWFGYAGFCFANPAAWSGAFIMVVVSYFIIMRNMGRKQKAGIETDESADKRSHHYPHPLSPEKAGKRI